MTPQEIRIAVAEEMGLEDVHKATRNFKRDPNGVILLFLYANTGGEKEYEVVPNYLVDLNAMREAEEGLTDEEFMRYETLLGDLTGFPILHFKRMRGKVSATALQRAEAFLRVKGKWRE